MNSASAYDILNRKSCFFIICRCNYNSKACKMFTDQMFKMSKALKIKCYFCHKREHLYSSVQDPLAEHKYHVITMLCIFASPSIQAAQLTLQTTGLGIATVREKHSANYKRKKTPEVTAIELCIPLTAYTLIYLHRT